jgi:alkanesulfonate monooxygenase SsuD/methylene tetrahydromethanopterin reductase-like flavin-dependent oxidoreductase (luciferase family)
VKISFFRQPRGDAADLPGLLREIVEEAQAADRNGFDSFFVSEHHNQSDRLSSALTLCGIILARTERLRVGTSVLTLPLHHPLFIAEAIGLLDVMSGGRVHMAFGMGYVPEDFAAYGIPMSGRIERFREALEVLRGAWTVPNFSYRGRFFELEEAVAYPKPIQSPHPPLMVGAWSDQGVRLAGEWGDGWLADEMPTMTEIGRWLEIYRAGAKIASRPERVLLMRDGWVADSWEQAAAEFGPSITNGMWPYVAKGLFRVEGNPWIRDVRSREDFTFEKLAQGDRFVMGSASECIEQLRRIEATYGIEHVVIGCRYGSEPSHEQVLKQIQRWGTEVIPGFAQSTSAVPER